MTRFLTLIVAAATCLCFSAFAPAAFAPAAFAHDGVHIVEPYARTTGGAGGNAAVFLVVENHQTMDDQLLSVASDAAQVVELHTHSEDANGVMSMTAVPEGFTIPGNGTHALSRGGDHVMMMGLTADLVDGDVITLTLTFRDAGVVTVQAVVDNARKAGAMGHMAHDGAKVSP